MVEKDRKFIRNFVLFSFFLEKKNRLHSDTVLLGSFFPLLLLSFSQIIGFSGSDYGEPTAIADFNEMNLLKNSVPDQQTSKKN